MIGSKGARQHQAARWWVKAVGAAICALGAGMAAAAGSAVKAAPAGSTDYTGDVVYHLLTDRFVDGNPANNPPVPLSSKDCQLTLLYCGGDWEGVVQVIKTGYFNDLGVTALLLTVPYENVPMVVEEQGAGYHGYWPRDMKRPNPAFGTMDEFRRLVQVAHAHGLKVMIDIITNHGSPVRPEDPRFAENGALYDDGRLLATYASDKTGLYNRYGEADYSSAEDVIYKSLYDLADFNHQHPVIDRYMKEMVRLWLDTGIDGLRVDTVKHVSLGWQRTWMETVYRHRPVFAAGEWYMPRDELQPLGFVFANDSGMSVLDFPLSQKVRQVFRYRERDLFELDRMVAETARRYRRPLDQVVFIDNHDMNRATLSHSAEHRRLVDQALAFVLTSRGVPMLFYGTEHYTLGAGHAPINRPMMRSFERDTPAFKLIKRLADLRRENPALRYGDQVGRWVSAEAYVYERRFHGNSVLVAINRSQKAAAEVPALRTGLGCHEGQPARHDDVLAQRFGGHAITVDCEGGVAPFRLAPGAIAVWSQRDSAPNDPSRTPAPGHVGPPLAWPGTEVAISGTHFGPHKDVVWIGNTRLQGSAILSWSDEQIRLRLPAMPAGQHAVKVGRGEQLSEPLGGLEVVGEPLVSLRLVVDEAEVAPGEEVHAELAPQAPCNAERRVWGPMYNKIVHRYPSWYMDISAPAGCRVAVRFFKKKPDAAAAVWESGEPHRADMPAGGTGTLRVRLRGWQPGTTAAVAR